MDESEFAVNTPWPPEDQDMVLPPPNFDPWATQDPFFPSSAFAPGDLGDMSLFPDFRPIQTPTTKTSDRDYEASHAQHHGGACEAQQSANDGADISDVFAQFTWEDGLQAIEEFDWPVSKSSRESKHPTQDIITPTREAPNDSAAATTFEHDSIMEDAPEYTVSAKPHPEQQAPRSFLETPAAQHDIMEDVEEDGARDTYHMAAEPVLRGQGLSEPEAGVDEDQEEDMYPESGEASDEMNVEDRPGSSKGQQIDLVLRPSASTAEDRPAQREAGQLINSSVSPLKPETTQIVAENRVEEPSSDIEKSLEISGEDGGTGSQSAAVGKTLYQLHDNAFSILLVEEARQEDKMKDEFDDAGSSEERVDSSGSAAAHDVTPANPPSDGPQQAILMHPEDEQHLKAAAQDEDESQPALVASEEVGAPHLQSLPKSVVSSRPAAGEQRVGDADEAVQEDQDVAKSKPTPKMQIMFIPQITDATDTEDEQVAEGPHSATARVEVTEHIRSPEADVASSSSDGDAPAKKKLKTSLGDQADAMITHNQETSLALSPEAAPKHQISLKSPKESGRDGQDASDDAHKMEQDAQALPEDSAQTHPPPEHHDKAQEFPASMREGPAIPTEPHHDAEKAEASVDNDYDMQERLSDVHSSPAKPSPRPTLSSTARPTRNAVSNWEIMSLSSTLTPNMHIEHGGRATRARKPAVSTPAGYYDEGEDEGDVEDDEHDEPTPIISKKKRSSTATKKSQPAAKKAKTQQPRQRAAIGIKSEQRRREISDAEDDDEGDEYTPETISKKKKKKSSTKSEASKAASSKQTMLSKGASRGKKTLSQASRKSKSEKSVSTAPTIEEDDNIDVQPAPTSIAANNSNDVEDAEAPPTLPTATNNDDDATADVEAPPTPNPPPDADNDDDADFEPTEQTPTPTPAPSRAPPKPSALRNLLPKPTSSTSTKAAQAPSTPSILNLAEAKRKKFGFKPSPKNTRSRASKGKDVVDTEAQADSTLVMSGRGDAKGKGKAKTTLKENEGKSKSEAATNGKGSAKGGGGSSKGKGKASTPVEEPPKTRAAAKKERRSLRSAGAVD